ncbi:hypothetical protein Fot_28356 [Forsythia ovata]|uniref:Uncharacterized protein n=1 Tax=Forsythia ovata TaxID=205694 RepID=A0ABD1TPL7_9LAMI
MTRSAAKKESPNIVKKPVFHSKQKVIYLDTPTLTKGSIFEKNRNPYDEGGHRRMGSCSSKGMHKNENMDKPMSNKVAHTGSPSKIKKPPVYEAQFYTDDVMEHVEEILKSAEKSKNSDTIEHKLLRE